MRFRRGLGQDAQRADPRHSLQAATRSAACGALHAAPGISGHRRPFLRGIAQASGSLSQGQELGELGPSIASQGSLLGHQTVCQEIDHSILEVLGTPCPNFGGNLIAEDTEREAPSIRG